MVGDGKDWARKPVSVIAFNAVLELEKKGVADFMRIADDLRKAGHLEGNQPVRVYSRMTKHWVAV
jgi:hypothetical protein